MNPETIKHLLSLPDEDFVTAFLDYIESLGTDEEALAHVSEWFYSAAELMGESQPGRRPTKNIAAARALLARSQKPPMIWPKVVQAWCPCGKAHTEGCYESLSSLTRQLKRRLISHSIQL